MAKLTLKVDAAVIARAKRYAARHGTSITGLVERFLAMKSDTGSYLKYLERKYR